MLPALTDVIASLSETEPSFGVRSSALVVTVTVAATAGPAQASAVARAATPPDTRIRRAMQREYRPSRGPGQ